MPCKRGTFNRRCVARRGLGDGQVQGSYTITACCVGRRPFVITAARVFRSVPCERRTLNSSCVACGRVIDGKV